MDKDAMIALWESWSMVDQAVSDVTTAMPSQIGERIAQLEEARGTMRVAMQRASLSARSACPAAPSVGGEPPRYS